MLHGQLVRGTGSVANFKVQYCIDLKGEVANPCLLHKLLQELICQWGWVGLTDWWSSVEVLKRSYLITVLTKHNDFRLGKKSYHITESGFILLIIMLSRVLSNKPPNIVLCWFIWNYYCISPSWLCFVCMSAQNDLSLLTKLILGFVC